MANEMAMRTLYFDLWRRAASHDPDLAELWEGMAREEATHATLLRQLKDALSPEQLEVEVSFPVHALDRAANEVERFRLRLRDGVDADDIFRFVLDAELGEQNRVLMQVVQVCPAEVAAAVYEQLKDPVDGHLKSLCAQIERRTEDADLRARVTGLR